jgi:acyl carrier protein
MSINLMQRVVAVLSNVLGENVPEKINPRAKLKEDLGLDSMSSLTFLMALEESIEGFVVDPQNLDLSDLECLETITLYVEKQLSQVH